MRHESQHSQDCPKGTNHGLLGSMVDRRALFPRETNKGGYLVSTSSAF